MTDRPRTTVVPRWSVHRRAASPVWSQQGFPRIWIALSGSHLGSQVTLFALPTLAVIGLGASNLQVGLLRALDAAAFPVLGLLVGALADYGDARRLLISADLVRLVALGSVPVSAALGVLTMSQLYVVAAVVGVGFVFSTIPFMAVVPRLVDRPLLAPANARLTLAESVAEVSGPGLAALLVRMIGAANALLVDVASYVLSIWMVLGIPRERLAPPPAASRPRLGKALGEGIRLVLRNEVLRGVVCVATVANLAFGAAPTVLLLMWYRELGHHPASLGFALSCGSAGLVAGSVVVNRMIRLVGYAGTFASGVALLAGSFVVLCLIPFQHTELTAAVVLSAGWLVQSTSGPIINVAQGTIRQSITPQGLQGRMNAAIRTFGWGALPVGSALGSWLSGVLGYSAVLALCGVLAGLAILPILLSRVRLMRRDADLAREESRIRAALGGEPMIPPGASETATL
jgi:MFS family permease